MGPARGRAGGRNRLRIIGGRWRGRRIRFPAREGLRPTPDRVRETLFNWLRADVAGSFCLDLFAGSGALALEALSRGAAGAVLVDRDPGVVAALRQALAELGAGEAEVVRADAVDYLAGPARPVDLVFLDPPFGRGYLERCCPLLEAGGWLRAGGLVYLEAEADRPALPLPVNWDILRSRSAGRVAYHLARRRPA